MPQKAIIWQRIFLCYAFALCFCLITFTEANFMKIHKSKVENLYDCNDHIEKLWLNISFPADDNTTNLIDIVNIDYDVLPCVNAEECGHFKNLTKINWNEFYAKPSLLIIHFNSFYKYKFDISVKRNVSSTSVNESLAYKSERICQNLDYEKFYTCSQYRLVIDDDVFNETGKRGNCSFELVRQNASRSFIKYIYLGIFVLFVGFLISKTMTIVYTKYRIIK